MRQIHRLNYSMDADNAKQTIHGCIMQLLKRLITLNALKFLQPSLIVWPTNWPILLTWIHYWVNAEFVKTDTIWMKITIVKNTLFKIALHSFKKTLLEVLQLNNIFWETELNVRAVNQVTTIWNWQTVSTYVTLENISLKPNSALLKNWQTITPELLITSLDIVSNTRSKMLH